jgi:hypothetical protein
VKSYKPLKLHMDLSNLKLGKRAPAFDSRDLLLSDFAVKRRLPKPPRQFGHEYAIHGWGMLGNDEFGDCVPVGAAHEHMVWTGGKINFTTDNVLGDYSAVTGFLRDDPATDQGTIMLDFLNYRRHTGIMDASLTRRKLGAFVRISTDNYAELLQAAYIFGAVGIGIEFPSSAAEQFDQGKPWKPVAGASIEGGHYVPVIARRSLALCVTWGRLQPFTKAFYEKYCDEAYALLSPDFLTNGRSPEGFDLASLNDALNSLKA